MRQLHEADREALLCYLQDEEAYNLFIIGDVENYGLSDEHISVAVHECHGEWDSLVLRYHESFVVYAKQEDYDAAAVADYIKEQPYEIVSGKGNIVNKLVSYFPDRKPRMTLLSRCDASLIQNARPHNADIRRIQPHETDKVVKLFCAIDEYLHMYKGRESAQSVRMARELQRGGMGFGAFIGDDMVSYAQITARNSRSAMVVGVGTHPDYRRQGFASAVMQTLCKTSFESGLSFLCLFYDNPGAGRIYHHIGFVELGEYLMLVPRKEKSDEQEDAAGKI